MMIPQAGFFIRLFRPDKNQMSSQDDRPGVMVQASFPFPAPQKSFADLDITASNAAAITVVQRHEQWPMSVLCLVGPARCGLTTVAQAWVSELSGAYYSAVSFDALDTAEIDPLASRILAIDNADLIKNEGKLLTLLNRINEKGGKLLLTSNIAPPLWRVRSADLASRLKSMPVTEITPPDEATLQTRLQALARQHYLRLDDITLAYIARRLGRDYAAVDAFVSLLSDAVTKTGRAPSVHLAREVLEGMQAREQNGE